MTLDPTKDYTATIKTAKGDIVIHLDAKDSPQTVNNFVYLAKQGYYNGTYFWRVETPGKPSPIDPSGNPSQLSLIQGGSVQDDGDPNKNYPGYTIPDELTTRRATAISPATSRWRIQEKLILAALSSSSTPATTRSTSTRRMPSSAR